jgi:hypothetical protein
VVPQPDDAVSVPAAGDAVPDPDPAVPVPADEDAVPVLAPEDALEDAVVAPDDAPENAVAAPTSEDAAPAPLPEDAIPAVPEAGRHRRPSTSKPTSSSGSGFTLRRTALLGVLILIVILGVFLALT